jgi:hypothetical protein
VILCELPFIQFPGVSAKWVIGSVALFHTAVASLAIGFAFTVTVLQIVGYRQRNAGYDLMAKRVQLWHVCIYNIGTINAIGLVFMLGGLYPQFWSQLFVGFFWSMIVEEFTFFLLATTLTLHYFFWNYLVTHKKLHIFLGSLLTPLFFVQFYLINGMGGFMLTPGAAESSITQWGGTAGILGYDKAIFYNPSFLMLTLHRTAANFSYGAFFVAGVAGMMLYFVRRDKLRRYYESGGALAYQIAFIALLALPVIGFFYAWVLKYWAVDAYNNLMFGRGDVVAGGLDWWWTKHIVVASMIGMGLYYFWHAGGKGEGVRLPRVMVCTVAALYFVFYLGMGMQMTWLFFVVMVAVAAGAAGLARNLLNRNDGSPRGVFVLVGMLSFATVMLGGYVREASRPRFVTASGQSVAGENRISAYDDVYVPAERQSGLSINMVVTRPAYVATMPSAPIRPDIHNAPAMIDRYCTSCHTLERLRLYPRNDWGRVVPRMVLYGAPLSVEQEEAITEYLKSGGPY